MGEHESLETMESSFLSFPGVQKAICDVGKDFHLAREYFRWWVLQKIFPNLNFPMLSDRVDAFWHAHLLHTREYERESKAFFGYFLHHSPYGALNPSETEANFDNGIARFQQMKDIYFSTFHE